MTAVVPEAFPWDFSAVRPAIPAWGCSTDAAGMRHKGDTGRTSMIRLLEPRIDRFAFEGEDAEDALVDFAERASVGEMVEGLEAEGEFAFGHRAFVAEASLPEAGEIFRGIVSRAVDDAQVFAATAFNRRLDDAATAAGDEIEGFYHHSFAAGCGERFPPTEDRGALGVVGKIRALPVGGGEKDRVGMVEAGGGLHVPKVVAVGEDSGFTG